MKVTHILNGDSLRQQLPSSISGNVIVARECLVDGNVQGDSLEALFENRAQFIESYQEVAHGTYNESSVPEFEKMLKLTEDDKIFVWFEDDLFCQVNYWFVIYLLANYTQVNEVFLVRPNRGNEYSFGFMNESQLVLSYKNSILVTGDDFAQIAKLWPLFQQENYSKMLDITHSTLTNYEFILKPAIKAQIERLPDAQGLGRPQRSLLAIINELNSKEFAVVFRLFCQREAIYSFGDLQVKRMFDALILRDLTIEN